MTEQIQVFLASIDQTQEEKFSKTFVNSISAKNLEHGSLSTIFKNTKKIYIWGFSLSEKNKTVWNNIKKNDWFFYYLDGKYSYAGQVEGKKQDKSVASKLWETSKSLNKMELLVLFKDVMQISLGFLKTNHTFGIESSIPTMHKISFIQANQDSVNKILNDYNGIKNFIKKISLDASSTEQFKGTIQPDDIKEPPRKFRANTIRFIRDTAKSAKLKMNYNNKCQICGYTINLGNDLCYSEAHHVWPLGEGGVDDYDNMIVLCPNHHAEFDYSTIGFHLNDKNTIIDRFGESVGKIHFKKEHSLKLANMEYHQRRMRLNKVGS